MKQKVNRKKRKKQFYLSPLTCWPSRPSPPGAPPSSSPRQRTKQLGGERRRCAGHLLPAWLAPRPSGRARTTPRSHPDRFPLSPVSLPSSLPSAELPRASSSPTTAETAPYATSSPPRSTTSSAASPRSSPPTHTTPGAPQRPPRRRLQPPAPEIAAARTPSSDRPRAHFDALCDRCELTLRTPLSTGSFRPCSRRPLCSPTITAAGQLTAVAIGTVPRGRARR